MSVLQDECYSVKVINNVAPLSNLRSNSKYRWFKRITIKTIPRILVLAIVLVFLAALLASTFSTLASAVNVPRSPHPPLSLPLFSMPSDQESDSHISTFAHPALGENVKSAQQDRWRSSLTSDLSNVITNFMNTAPVELYSATAIRQHFINDENNSHNTTMLVSIQNGVASFTHHFPESRHGRAASVKYMVEKLLRDRLGRGVRPLNVTFPVMVNDGHRPHVAMFGSARHWKHWNTLIPVPLGNQRGVREGWGTPLDGWDKYVLQFITSTHSEYPWESKLSKAMFRGALGMQTYTLGSCNWDNGGACKKALRWSEVNRGVMYVKSKTGRDFFDIGFTSHKTRPSAPKQAFDGAPDVVENLPFEEFQKYKYLLNVGSNQDWAERLRCLLFTNSAVVLHEAETQEFFTPLLKPWEHYIPTNLMFTDLVANVKWAVQNDEAVKRIVSNQLVFAHSYLTEDAMQLYWEIALEEFAVRQQHVAAGSSNVLKK